MSQKIKDRKNSRSNKKITSVNYEPPRVSGVKSEYEPKTPISKRSGKNCSACSIK
jgi:hypothetical protein